MHASFETTVPLPALKDGFSLADIDVRVTVKGDIEGYAADGTAEWDFCIEFFEGSATKATPELCWKKRFASEYQEIEKGSWLHTILTAELEKDPSFQEQAEQALALALLDQKHAAE